LPAAGIALRGWVGAVTLVFGTSALVLCLHNSMSLRYEVEYAHVLVLLAVLGIFGLERALTGQRVWLRIARWAWSLLLAFSVAFNLFAAIVRHAEVENAVGAVLLKRGRTSEAIAHFQKALTIQPDEAERPNNLAWVLATCGDASVRDGLRAVALAERANMLAGGSSPAILDTLAAAYAEAGRFGDAVRTAQAALKLVQQSGQMEPARQFQERLKLYQAGRQYHEGSTPLP
jgi:tetratricopeptide (TPR) repeat protein